MAQVKSGDKALDFTFDTLSDQGLKLSDVVKNADKTVVHFLRYYGCTLCQLDIREYINKINLITDKNAQLYIVLQSKPETIKSSAGEMEFPFEIICDPDQTIYKQYDIGSFKSKASLVSIKLISKMNKAKKMNLVHGEYEGNEEQLPALFIIDKDMNVKYALYSKDLTSIPTVEEIAKML